MELCFQQHCHPQIATSMASALQVIHVTLMTPELATTLPETITDDYTKW